MPHRLTPENGAGLSRNRIARLAALVMLGATLYSGDRTEYQGEIFIGSDIFETQLTSGRTAVRSEFLQEQAIQIATYNVKRGLIDREGVIETARSLGADVLGVTEGGRVASEIADDDYQTIFAGDGNVLLTKFPINSYFTKTLPGKPGDNVRTAIFADLDIGKKNQWFVLTHLEHNDWPDSARSTRLEQLSFIQEIIDNQLDGEAIIIGDLNFTPQSPEYSFMDEEYDDALTDLGLGDIGTFQSLIEQKRYDYLFVDPDLGFKVIAAGRKASRASDHWAIQAVLVPDRDEAVTS